MQYFKILYYANKKEIFNNGDNNNWKVENFAPILKIFDPNLPTRLKTDASSEGLGAILEQNHRSLENPQWHPIVYSSRALRDYQKQYVQIEEETLSIVFGVEHFHEYLYGRKFTIINDHQPLKLIFSRSIVTCPPRIQ